ncbi:hypothetical protein BDY17DRAFT_107251 [Neohortaea acidophila]|uniref:Mss4-like protein n=1 Tax=Neohortaea acidophila TaxID=245834 RepID=A0A6A6PZD7_9PEZI|nr:uncharacterized protein BDY17DRAFT_107251 [Neohortaea acidophila]KAF2485568.1 hypothetical protein BDY17DRAFT_107251 [Neohortaea acidophila]
MPFVCTDHCNDCRRATGALLPFWLLCPTDMISISLVQKSSELEDGRLDTSRVPRGPWISALDVFLAKGPVEDTYLSFFASSPDRRRSFCQRCGTMFAFCAFPTPDFIKFPMLDLLLGTIDRYILEERFLSPERQLHWQTGIDWIREFSKDGLEGVPVYLTSNVATSMALTK